ncbi:flavin reductase family protein [Mycobacteroides abscessus]|uniref:flavin reductase family protein n=1 Tax=Mycobacteroides abscessus TaxID=36809 RepID=UPI0021052A60|nr:flavin reductase family protein [Mycobacteroides abscessus]
MTVQLAPTKLRPPHSATMRAVLGRFRTGITVITGHDGQSPLGFTCQPVTSASLDPPYVSFCPARTSSIWPQIRSVGRLCINVLATDQWDVCTAFVDSLGKKFAENAWTRGSNGAPALDGAIAVIEADFEFEYSTGDHTVVVTHVTGLRAREGSPRPLRFYRGGFGEFDER